MPATTPPAPAAPAPDPHRDPGRGVVVDAALSVAHGPARPIPREGLAALFAAQVARTPDAPAVVCGETSLTYAQLHARARAIAGWLAARGVGRGSFVGVHQPRATDMAAALIAVQMTGAAAVPMDPQYPPARLAHILADAQPAALVTARGLAGLDFPAPRTLVLGAPADEAALETPCAPARDDATPEDPCWVLYTSGSTGRPKGAVLRRAAIASFYDWFAAHFDITAETRTVVVTSLGFDLTQRMLWVPLLHGGRVVLPDTDTFDPGLILAAMDRHGVDVFSSTPSGLYGLIDAATDAELAILDRLHLVVPGGEVLDLSRLGRWTRRAGFHAQVVNSYGPTETHDLITTYQATPAEIKAGTRLKALGWPLANVRLYVLDDTTRQPVRLGEAGVLHVGGLPVGLGYRNLPEKTAEVFLPDPLVPGQTMYRVGDVVRMDASGCVFFEGRTDHQVKIRGWRIELPEVEAALASHPGVREAIADAPTGADGERFLAAWVQLRPGVAAGTDDLRRHLAARVPEFMQPSAWTFVEAFRLNPNGKVDRQALPPIGRGRPPLSTAFRAPASALERRLAGLWRDALGVDGLGADDRFFELGGTSLKAAAVVARLTEALGGRVPVALFYAHPTIAGLAAALARQQPVAARAWAGADPLQAPVATAPDDDDDMSDEEFARMAAAAGGPLAPPLSDSPSPERP